LWGNFSKLSEASTSPIHGLSIFGSPRPEIVWRTYCRGAVAPKELNEIAAEHRE
jgi:hypothetical protein